MRTKTNTVEKTTKESKSWIFNYYCLFLAIIVLILTTIKRKGDETRWHCTEYTVDMKLTLAQSIIPKTEK